MMKCNQIKSERMKIKYHSVLKKMTFERHENGRWVSAGDASNSLLFPYVTNENILLQNLGNRFFQDIIDSMDEISKVILDFEGTKEDYEDLKKMIDHYQDTGRASGKTISVGDLAELPAVGVLFEDIMNYSDATSSDFRKMMEDLNKGSKWHSDKKGEVSDICTDLENWLMELDKRREGLKENAVNLCFVGSYSSGKSTLINALVGASILPESIQSETAKMFKITQIPEESQETPSIAFRLIADGSSYDVEIKWDEEDKISLFNWPQNNTIRKDVQRKINDTVGQKRHVQMREILSSINSQPGAPESENAEGHFIPNTSYIDGIVNIRYSFDLKARVLFHIYDTPGTDSNNPEHLATLKKALADPVSSILVYVNAPMKMEGAANETLLNILTRKETGGESKGKGGSDSMSTGSTIDLSRSFFVINHADTIKDATEIMKLQEGVLRLRRLEGESSSTEGIKESRPVEIKLKEKRLFFTDALHAGDAQALKNGLAEGAEKKRLMENKKLINTDWYHLYQYDIMAQAEVDTERLRKEAAAELMKIPNPEEQLEEKFNAWLAKYGEAVQKGAAEAEAFKKQNPMPSKDSVTLPPEAYYICSGVYSLQREIERYAERFALAVRAKGIIEGTRDLIEKLDCRCHDAKKFLRQYRTEKSARNHQM